MAFPGRWERMTVSAADAGSHGGTVVLTRDGEAAVESASIVRNGIVSSPHLSSPGRRGTWSRACACCPFS